MATLKELSAITGYSVTTISRVLNEDESLSVSASTRKTILEAAEKLEYTKKKGEERGRKDDSVRVGIVEMMDLQHQLEDTFYLYLRNSVEKHCYEKGFRVISLLYHEEEKVYRPAEGEDWEGVQGVIAIGQFTADKIVAMEQLADSLVFVDSSPDEEKYPSVLTDYNIGIRQGVKYLTEMGHRKIAFVGPEKSLNSRGESAPEVRRGLFCDCIRGYGEEAQGICLDTIWMVNDVSDRIISYLKEDEKPATAFFAFNEAVAVGIIRALHALGYQIPEDFSVLGYNDTVLATLTDPPLSGIHIPLDAMASMAVECMERKLRGELQIPLKMVFSTTLTERESVRRLKR